MRAAVEARALPPQRRAVGVVDVEPDGVVDACGAPAAAPAGDDDRVLQRRVELDDLLPGDLLYYQDGTSPRSGHISMYAGNGLAVEAANPRRGVRVRDLYEPWYRDRFIAATRVG